MAGYIYIKSTLRLTSLGGKDRIYMQSSISDAVGLMPRQSKIGIYDDEKDASGA
jgi:hypothetical protein